MTSLTQTVKPGFLKRNQWRLILISALLLIASVLAWRYYESRYPSWYEEVRLSDGRIITIHQKREYYENYGTSQSWVTIDLPELGGKRVWHSYLMPQRVDVVNGKVYVFEYHAEQSNLSITNFRSTTWLHSNGLACRLNGFRSWRCQAKCALKKTSFLAYHRLPRVN